MSVAVALPKPWWNSLTYGCDRSPAPGCRVTVPLGRGNAVGIVLGEDRQYVGPLRSCCVIDDEPVLSPSVMAALNGGAREGLCSFGALAAAFLPPGLMRGEQWPAAREEPLPGVSRFMARYGDGEKLELAVSAIEACQGDSLVLVPDGAAFRIWGEVLERHFAHRLLKLTSWQGKKGQLALQRLNGESGLVVLSGPYGGLTPLLRPALLVVEEPASAAYLPQKGVPYSGADLAVARFEASGSGVLLLGRAPDGAQLLKWKPREVGRPRRAPLFLQVGAVKKEQMKGFEFPLPLAKPVVEQTAKILAQGGTALWLLDRKGYAGSLRCQDCGEVAACPRCSGPLQSVGGMAHCRKCGWNGTLPGRCSQCGSEVLQYRSPGLEALLPLTAPWAGADRVFLYQAGSPATDRARRELLSALKAKGGLVLGSRRALELLSLLPVGLVVWLDGDDEGRRPDYGAGWGAFAMTLESLCRGTDHQVMIQTRRPGKGWQRGLTRGWTAFWNSELVDRRALDFPPYRIQVRLLWPDGEESDMIDILLDGGVEVQADEEGLTLWVEDLTILRNLLAPRMQMSQSRRGFPQMILRRS